MKNEYVSPAVPRYTEEQREGGGRWVRRTCGHRDAKGERWRILASRARFWRYRPRSVLAFTSWVLPIRASSRSTSYRRCSPQRSHRGACTRCFRLRSRWCSTISTSSCRAFRSSHSTRAISSRSPSCSSPPSSLRSSRTISRETLARRGGRHIARVCSLRRTSCFSRRMAPEASRE